MPKFIKDNYFQIIIGISGLVGMAYILHANVGTLLTTTSDHESRIRKLEIAGPVRDQAEHDLSDKVDGIAADVKTLLRRQ